VSSQVLLCLDGPATLGYKSGPPRNRGGRAAAFRGKEAWAAAADETNGSIVSTGPLATSTPLDSVPWTARSLIAAHKVGAAVVAALGVVVVVVLLLVVLGPRAGAVTDSTTCAQWGSTNVNGQQAYGKLYLKEHGPVARGWGSGPAGVINAINAGCDEAFGEDVDDTATVVQAISRDF
jgi:hypothetical protein